MAELALLVTGLGILVGFVVYVAKQAKGSAETKKNVAEKEVKEVKQAQRAMGNYQSGGGLRGAVQRGLSKRKS
jgi:hypothetical protein